MSVSAKKDSNGTWRIQYRYTDWKGEKKKSQKRGFRTKKEAEEWLQQFLLRQSGNLTMTFSDFWKVYKADMQGRVRESTMIQKEYIVKEKLLPYFGDIPLNEITAPKIRAWQNEMMSKGYKETYLKTINNHLSCIMNYAVRFYDLQSNPCHKAGSMGKSRAEKMDYWTVEEFNRFEDAIVDKHSYWLAFKVLFWTGMRIGELLALTVGDIDFDEGTITINKSLNRINKEDIITPPKTEASNRTITMPDELAKDLKEYVEMIYKPKPTKRVFMDISKATMEKELKYGIKSSGVKKIHIHCLRHSHASMLVQLGYSPVEIAARLGHGKVTTTIETYCHPSQDAQEKIARKLSQIEKTYQQQGVEELDEE